ncbi:trypsin-like peptidase domain-containing protein [Streptomyces sp. NPDC101152]|uniref:trypsin-like peptidase domain-containing protein n=1 Tax=Streptomyces sp. NPDC101152 TaxID=3366116 RepID=UPI0037F259D8
MAGRDPRSGGDRRSRNEQRHHDQATDGTVVERGRGVHGDPAPADGLEWQGVSVGDGRPRLVDGGGQQGSSGDEDAARDVGGAEQQGRPSRGDAKRRARRRTGGRGQRGAAGAGGRADGDGLVRVRDLAGRPRGTGFLADLNGTVITSHEAVAGLPTLVLHTADDRSCLVTADAVTPLPALNLALVRTEGLGVDPLPVTTRDRIETGAYVRLPAGCWREARVLGTTSVTYTATDRFHIVEDALELAIGTAGQDALRLGGGAAGGPVLDADTGAVVAVLGTALQSAERDTGFAVPLRSPTANSAGAEALTDLLARNAATVPAYGADLNLAGVLELTATSVGQDGPPGTLAGSVGHSAPCGPSVEPVERAAPAREFAAFTRERGPAAVLGLVGVPGSGRTTELAALAARRHRGPEPAPTLWLRGADLHDDDTSVADAAHRALARAARIVAASASARTADLGDTGPTRLAHTARAANRPLLLLLDGPEEMPPALAHRLGEWSEGTADWLRETGARLVVACRAEYWETAGAEFPPDLLHAPSPHPPGEPDASENPPWLPPCVHLGDLTDTEARAARASLRIPEGALTPADARHPLTLRLLAEIRAALPATPDSCDGTPVDRHDVFSAYLDLMCLRVAVRLAAQNGLRGTAVRRLAAKVSGQVHEAARRSLGPGRGELDRPSFEAVFPWGKAPKSLGGGTGWASAVLTEGLLVPAGTGYRFAHEELTDWIQGMHLDLDEALHALVHRRPTTEGAQPLPVPHHRIGPVVQALLLVGRENGPAQLAEHLRELTRELEKNPQSWWAARLLSETLLHVPDATPYLDVLRRLADHLAATGRQARPEAAEAACSRRPPTLAPAFWTALRLEEADRFDLLRQLLLADGPPQDTAAKPQLPSAPRFLDTVSRLLAATPTAVQPLLARWFDDDRPLPATPHATVAEAAQALLYTHRHLALDDLTEVLVESAHRRADELLAVLAEDEPSAVCRAVDRWVHDERPARRVAAVAYGLRVAPHVRSVADRELLSYAALALLARPDDCTLHGGALALLVRDPHTRARHLPQALRHFATGDPHFPPGALVPALTTHPEPVLDAFRERLRRPEPGEALRTLADVTTPTLARRVATLVQEAVQQRPETAADVAAYVDRRLDQGPAARAVLLPLVTGLLDGGPEAVRAALAAALAVPGTPASHPLRRELLEFLLTHEHDPSVLDALLHAIAPHTGDEIRDLLHRTGLLLVRTPEGAARFDRGLVDLGRRVPGFAARMAGWLTDAPQAWAAVVGPSTRRMLENLSGVRVPA